MAISERRRAIQAGVEELRQHMGDAPVDDQPMPFGNLAELVGYTCALLAVGAAVVARKGGKASA